MLSQLVADVENLIAEPTSERASEYFFARMQRLGASYMQTRHYRRPTSVLTSESHFAAGGVIMRYAPPAWEHRSAFRYVCFQCNPLLEAIRSSQTRYRFSDFAPRDDKRYSDYWDACSEASIGDALCSTSYGRDGAIASLHLGFDQPHISPTDARDIQMAGLILTEKLMEFALQEPSVLPRLTVRELDCLRFVAEGKTDWEISVIFGISETTARFHIDNGRRKTGAVNRTQAVARLINQRLI